MLLPFEFLFPRGFFAADILVVFPSPVFELNFSSFLRTLDATFWNATLESYV